MKVLFSTPGQICLDRSFLPKQPLPNAVKGLIVRLFRGFCRNVGQIAVEVFLAPNLLSLCGCQGLCWLHIAKTFDSDMEIQQICNPSGQHSSCQLYLPSLSDNLLILLQITLNRFLHGFGIQWIHLCFICCYQLNCWDNSIGNVALLLSHSASDIGAVIH